MCTDVLVFFVLAFYFVHPSVIFLALMWFAFYASPGFHQAWRSLHLLFFCTQPSFSLCKVDSCCIPLRCYLFVPPKCVNTFRCPWGWLLSAGCFTCNTQVCTQNKPGLKAQDRQGKELFCYHTRMVQGLGLHTVCGLPANPIPPLLAFNPVGIFINLYAYVLGWYV